jgi:hypothetical protein
MVYGGWRVVGLSRLGGLWESIPHKHGSHRLGIVAKAAQALAPEEISKLGATTDAHFAARRRRGSLLKLGEADQTSSAEIQVKSSGDRILVAPDVAYHHIVARGNRHTSEFLEAVFRPAENAAASVPCP